MNCDGRFNGGFITESFQLSTSPGELIHVLNEHKKVVNERRVVAIIGILEAKMNDVVERGGTKVYVLKHMKRER